MKTLLLLGVSVSAFAQGLPFPGPGTAHSVSSSAISLVTGQKAISSQTGGQDHTISLAFPGSVVAGNLLKVGWTGCWDGACLGTGLQPTITSVTDSVGTSYALPPAKCDNSVGTLACIVSGIAGGSGANTVTITFSGSGGGGADPFYDTMTVAEFTGNKTSAYQDQVGSNVATGTNPSCATAGATSVSGELIYAIAFANSTGSGVLQGAGYTLLNQSSAKDTAHIYAIGSTPQVETALFPTQTMLGMSAL